MKKIILPLAKVKSREELHDILSGAFDFPSFYGRNMDALHDCLTDLMEETEVSVCLPEDGPDDYMKVLMRVLRDSARENPHLHIAEDADGGKPDQRVLPDPDAESADQRALPDPDAESADQRARKASEDTADEMMEDAIREVSGWVRGKALALGRPLRACVVTFGCQMNARDSEKIRGILNMAGYEDTESEEDADFVLYNTCTVRENANDRVYGRLGALSGIKKQRPHMIIALSGCMMQEKGEADYVRSHFPFVDLIFGTYNLKSFASLLREAWAADKTVTELRDHMEELPEGMPTLRKYRFKSGVNITYGCNNFCSYCIVPYVRGREISREKEDILREIEDLVRDGVKEVMLLGQNVNSYGKTLSSPVTFAELLREAAGIEGLERIRFMTSHPKDFSDELISVIAENEKICRHIHLPVQSGSTRILKKMNRRYTREDYLALVGRIREAIPDISLTTDIIVGFPGETEEDFEDTMTLVREAGYDSVFTFIYSKRSGTPAAAMENQVPEDVVKRRFDRLLALVHETSKERCARFEGMTLPVLVEEKNRAEGYVTGRLGCNLLVHFPGPEELIGEIVPVLLRECRGFYYMGERPEER